MANDFNANMDIGFTVNGLSRIVNDINRTLKSVGPVDIPVTVNGKGASSNPLNSTIGKSINSLNTSLSKTAIQSRTTSEAFVNLTKNINKIKDARKNIQDAGSELEKFGRQANQTVKRFGAFVLVVNAFNGLQQAITSSVSKAITFEKEMVKVSQVTGTAYRDLKGLTDEITRLSTTFGVSSEKIGNVALTLAQAGLSAKETKIALDVLAKTELSATFEDIGQTTEAAIAVMAQFGTKSKDLAGQLGAINTVAAKFAVESSDLAVVIRRAGGAFQATGGDLNELLALFTSVRATTRESAESIATGLRTIFTRLQRTKTLNFLEELGIDLRQVDAQGKKSFIGIYRSIEEISKALENIKGNDPRFNQIVEELGGFRQVSKVIPLLKQFETSQKALSVARRAGNSVDEDAILAQKTLANQFARVREEFDALIRGYLDDGAFKRMISLTLNLASALIKVGEAIRPIATSLTLLAGIGGIKAIGTISQGFFAKSPIKRSRGGPVPGSGNGDTIPAMLEPGEFVLRKSAVNALGMGNVEKINKYAGGGIVRRLLDTRARSKAGGLGSLFAGSENLAPAPKFSNQLKDLLSPGGFLRSLGVGRKNWFMGDAGYTSLPQYKSINDVVKKIVPTVKAAALPVPTLTTPTNLNLAKSSIQAISRTAPNMEEFKKSIAKLQLTGGGAFYSKILKGETSNLPRFKVPSSSTSIGPFPNPNLSPLPYNPSLVQRTDIEKRNGLRKRYFTQVSPEYLGSKKEVAQKLKLKKFLQDFQAKTDINPAGLINSVSVVKKDLLKSGRKEWTGAFNIKNRDIKLTPQNIKKGSSLDSVRSVKGALYHELGHAVDSAVGTKQFSSVVNDKSNQAKLAQIYKDLNIESRTALLNSKKISKKNFDYRGANEEEFANFFSEYLRGTIKVPGNKRRTVNSLIKKVLAGSAVQAKLNATASGRTLNDVVGLSQRKIRRFADGGSVPGSGDTDKVRALLTPGEYVINKKSAKAFGYDNLGKINKFNKGGPVIGSAGATGTVGLALSIGPALVQQFAGISEELKPFLEGLTLAGGLLTTFAFAIKKDVDPISQNLNDLKEASDAYANQLDMLERSSKELGKIIQGGTTDAVTLDREGKRVFKYTPEALKAKDTLTQDNVVRGQITKDKSENDTKLAAAEKELSSLTKFNKIAKTAVIGAAVAGAAGTYFNSVSNSRAKEGKAGAETFGAVGGGLTGAANGVTFGLTLGGLLGPKGALAGAIIGGIGGLISGAVLGKSEAANTVAQVKFEKTIEKLNRSLNLVNSGKSTIGQQRGNITGGLKEINDKFLTSTGTEFQSFKGQVNNSIDGLENLFNESIKSAKTLDQFKAANEDLILVLSRFGGQTIPELEKAAQGAIEKQNKAVDIQNDSAKNDRRLEEIFNIAGAVGDASRAIKSLGDNIDVLDQIINNSFASKNNFDFSALSNIGGSRLSVVQQQAQTAGNLIGGPAIGIAGDVTKAAELSRKIPSLLNDVINGGQLDEEGDARDKIRNRLGFGKEGGFAADLLSSAIDKEIGGTGSVTELIKKFNEDPVGLTKRVQAAVDPIINVLKDEAPRIVDEFNAYADGLARARGHLEKEIAGFISVIDIKQIGAEFKAASIGRTISFEEAQGFENERFNALGGKGRSVERLNFDLQTANKKILGAESAKNDPANQNQEAIKHLNDTIHENTIKSQEATRSLEYLADVNSRLINVQQELGRLRQERQNKASLGADFAFGDPAAQRDIFKGLLGVKTILGNIEGGKSPLAGLTNEMKELSRGILQRFAGDKVFNGKTGQEIENIVGGSITGTDFNVPTGKEAEVQKIGEEIIASSAKAQESLNNVLSTNIDTYIKKIDERFGTFFTELKAALAEKQNDAKAEFNAGIDTQISKVVEKLNTLDLIKQTTGADINDKKSIGQVKSVITDINKANEIFNKIDAVNAAKADFLRTGSTKNVERTLGSEFTKTLPSKISNFESGYGAEFGIAPDDSEKRGFINELFKEESNKLMPQAQALYADANEKLGAGVNGVVQNLAKLEKALADIDGETNKASLEEEKKRLEASKRAMGGIIGLASGGRVRGTDTVPAMTTDGKPYMLTPGEYVMKKSAVDKYGIGFMKKINMGYLASGGLTAGGKRVRDEIENQILAKRNDEFYGKKSVEQIIDIPTPSSEQLYRDQKAFFGQGSSIQGLNTQNRFAGTPKAYPVGVIPRRDTSFVDGMRAKRIEEERIKHNRNNINLDVKTNRNDNVNAARFAYQQSVNKMTPRAALDTAPEAGIDIIQKRTQFQKDRKALIAQGLSPKEASQRLLRGGGQALFNDNSKPHAQGASPVAGQQAVEKFNEVLTKLQGVKITLEGAVTVDVRILDSNLGDSLNNKFKEAVSELVTTKIDNALNQFASSNSLAYTPKPTGSKSVVKEQGK